MVKLKVPMCFDIRPALVHPTPQFKSDHFRGFAEIRIYVYIGRMGFICFISTLDFNGSGLSPTHSAMTNFEDL